MASRRLISMAATVLILAGAFPVMAATYAFVAGTGSGEIAVFALDPVSSSLDRVGAVPFADGGGETSPLAVSPDRRFLHVAVRSRPHRLVTFAIDPATAGLARIGVAPLPASLPFVTLDRTGRFLLAASYGDHFAGSGTMGASGMLEGTLGRLDDIRNAHAIVPDRANRFALVPALGSDDVHVLAIDPATGALTRHGRAALPARSGPRHLAWHPELDLVYVVGEHDARVHVLSYAPRRGTLELKSSVAARPAGDPPEGSWAAADIHVTPDARFLYASIRRDSTIASFALDAEGRPTYVASFPVEARPRSFAIDSSGRVLLVAGQDSGAVALHAIDGESGALTLIERYPVGANPSCVEFVELP